MARYGVVARGIDVGLVRGHLYIAPFPIAGPRKTRRTPPATAEKHEQGEQAPTSTRLRFSTRFP